MTSTPKPDLGTAPEEVIVIGAGPAGLTAAYQLAKSEVPAVVLEADEVVGGISRTVVRDGWRFDIGGHRFFTKVPEVEQLWHEILGPDELLLRPRKSRIYYRGKFFDYPIRPFNALRNLGPLEAVRCVLSYLWARVHPPRDRSSLEGYIASNYGWRLYRHFFETYNEKVWGVSAAEISADWGAQRIKGMSLWNAVWEPLRQRLPALERARSEQVTSLIEEFQYPRLGPGMMWERCCDLVQRQGIPVMLRTPVIRVLHAGGKATAVVARRDGAEHDLPCSHVVSSMPLPELIRAMDPPVPESVASAAADLRFRDFLCVALVVPESEVAWTDNWIYIHSPDVKTMRIQNFRSWSPYMVRDGWNVLGLEYTVSEGDDWWNAPDDVLIDRAKRELEHLELVSARNVTAGYVVRMPKAYPFYDEDYQRNVGVLRQWLRENASNVHPVGRNGMHRYNNQDHSMYTAMLVVENILGAEHDIWSVNVEGEYHEERRSAGALGSGRDAPVLPRHHRPRSTTPA